MADKFLVAEVGKPVFDNGTIKVLLKNDVLSLELWMHPTVAAMLTDTLAAANDLLRKSAAQAGTAISVGLYRRAEDVHVMVDGTETVLLLEFDADKPHRVGVSMPIEAAPAFARDIEKQLNRSRKRQRRAGRA